MPGGLLSALFSGMWHGYRRWMTMFNGLSIVLSVMLAMVIMGFTHGVRGYVDDMVRKEAAAGAVRINAGGWQPDLQDGSFAARVRQADDALRKESGKTYRGFNFWWRSEAHYLMPDHPAESDRGGIFVKLGNTSPTDPEAHRVRSYVVGGRWIADPEADEIVLSTAAAVKLAKRIEEADAVEDLLGRTIWITLPPTPDHLPGACARVKVVGIFDHLRDGACMTTPKVAQDMHARTMANAYGKWYETYDRLAYSVQRLGTDQDADLLTSRLRKTGPIPLVCWRTRDAATRWLSVRGRVASRGETEASQALRVQARALDAQLERLLRDRADLTQELSDVETVLQGSDETRQWLETLRETGQEVFASTEPPEDAAERLDDMVRQAVKSLALDADPTAVTTQQAFDRFYETVTNRVSAKASNLQIAEERLEQEISEADASVKGIEDHIDTVTGQADEIATASILPAEGPLVAEVVMTGGDFNASELELPTSNAQRPTSDSGSPVLGRWVLDVGRWALPHVDANQLTDVDDRYPEGYVLCSPRIWNELGYQAAPLQSVDDWREHAIYAYLYFDGLRPALAARSRLDAWGFETYMPIDRFKGLLALVRVVTGAAVTLLAAVLLAGLLGIVVTLYTEVDAEEAEIGLMKALGASNRMVGLVFLGKGALIGLMGVLAGVPLAWLIAERIDRGVSVAVARAAGLTDVDAGLFSQDPRMVIVAGVTVVGLGALAALMPALQAAAKDPQEALRAE